PLHDALPIWDLGSSVYGRGSSSLPGRTTSGGQDGPVAGPRSQGPPVPTYVTQGANGATGKHSTGAGSPGSMALRADRSERSLYSVAMCSERSTAQFS